MTEKPFDISALPMLSSPQNPRVKEYADLRSDGNVRRERNRFLLEGRRSVAAALSLPHVLVHEVVFSEHLLEDSAGAQGEKGLDLVARAHSAHIPMTRVSKDVFKKIADVMTPQGIAAVVRIPAWTLEDIFSRPDSLAVVACGIQDPGNLGTLIRSCEASGATGLITLEGSADAFNAKVVRATASGLLALPILRMKAADFLAEADRRKVRLVATSAREGKAYKAFDWKTRPIALCIGSEGEGLPAKIEEACTEKVTIPIKGKAESINAAVAASILLFEAS